MGVARLDLGMNSASMKLLRLTAGLCITGVCAVAASGCGGTDVPSDAVARVGNTVITKQAFDTWYNSAAKSQASQGGPSVPPDPPNFTKCVAALQEQQPEGSETGEAELKKQCRQSYNQLRQQVMQFLIQSQWVLQEAESQDVSASDKEVRSQFDEQKQQAFPKEADYKEFLRTSGTTEQNILFQIKLDILQRKITEKLQKEQGKVTEEDVKEYYDKNQERFAQPERRDLQVVLTKNKGQAEQAKTELEDGANFKAVAEEYSIDEASKANGGKLAGLAEGQQEEALDEAVFGAEQGVLVGPVKTQFGWYVFKVNKVTDASQQSLADAKETIRGLLKSEREQKALTDFAESFREEFKDETKCREGFVVAECSNAPQEETDTNATPAAPQGGQQQAPQPQQQAPQQQAPQPQQ